MCVNRRERMGLCRQTRDGQTHRPTASRIIASICASCIIARGIHTAQTHEDRRWKIAFSPGSYDDLISFIQYVGRHALHAGMRACACACGMWACASFSPRACAYAWQSGMQTGPRITSCGHMCACACACDMWACASLSPRASHVHVHVIVP